MLAFVLKELNPLRRAALKFLGAIFALWDGIAASELNLRLGQLIHNAFGKIPYPYLFDDELISLFEQFLPKKKARPRTRKRSVASAD